MKVVVKIALAACALVGLMLLMQQSPAPSGAGRLWIGEEVLWDRILHSEAIPVPSEVSESGAEGVMVSWLVVDKEGDVQEVSVVQTPHPKLPPVLEDSFQRWTFEQTRVRGYLVEVTGKVILYLVNDNGVGRFLEPVEVIEQGKAQAFRVEATDGVQLVDARDRDEFERDHDSRAVNIPLDELQVRSPVELSADKPVLIDCSRSFFTLCAAALDYLNGEGFEQVAIEGEGIAECPKCE